MSGRISLTGTDVLVERDAHAFPGVIGGGADNGHKQRRARGQRLMFGPTVTSERSYAAGCAGSGEGGVAIPRNKSRTRHSWQSPIRRPLKNHQANDRRGVLCVLSRPADGDRPTQRFRRGEAEPERWIGSLLGDNRGA